MLSSGGRKLGAEDQRFAVEHLYRRAKRIKVQQQVVVLRIAELDFAFGAVVGLGDANRCAVHAVDHQAIVADRYILDFNAEVALAVFRLVIGVAGSQRIHAAVVELDFDRCLCAITVTGIVTRVVVTRVVVTGVVVTGVVITGVVVTGVVVTGVVAGVLERKVGRKGETTSVEYFYKFTARIEIQRQFAGLERGSEFNFSFRSVERVDNLDGAAFDAADEQGVGANRHIFDLDLEIDAIGLLFELGIPGASREQPAVDQVDLDFAVAEFRRIVVTVAWVTSGCVRNALQHHSRALENLDDLIARVKVQQQFVVVARRAVLDLAFGSVGRIGDRDHAAQLAADQQLVLAERDILDFNVELDAPGCGFEFGLAACARDDAGGQQRRVDFFCIIISVAIVGNAAAAICARLVGQACNPEVTVTDDIGSGLERNASIDTVAEPDLHAADLACRIVRRIVRLHERHAIDGIYVCSDRIALDGSLSKKPGGFAEFVIVCPIHNAGFFSAGQAGDGHYQALILLFRLTPPASEAAGDFQRADASGSECQSQRYGARQPTARWLEGLD